MSLSKQNASLSLVVPQPENPHGVIVTVDCYLSPDNRIGLACQLSSRGGEKANTTTPQRVLSVGHVATHPSVTLHFIRPVLVGALCTGDINIIRENNSLYAMPMHRFAPYLVEYRELHHPLQLVIRSNFLAHSYSIICIDVISIYYSLVPTTYLCCIRMSIL